MTREEPGADGSPWDPVVSRILARTSHPADVRHMTERWLTLRLANSQIYQPIHEVKEYVSFRVIVPGNLMGLATTTDLSEGGIKTLVDSAEAMARSSQEPVALTAFPGPGHEEVHETGLAAVDLGQIAESAARSAAEALGTVAREFPTSRVAGVYNAGQVTLSVGNSSGRHRAVTRNIYQGSLLVEDLSVDPPVSGWAEGASSDPHGVSLPEIAHRALERIPRRKVSPLPPGSYDVVFGAPAIAELMNMLSMGGLGAFSVEEGSSFLSEWRDRETIAPHLTLWEDPQDAHGLPEPMDYDGLPTLRRKLFDHGVARGPAHDLLTAARAGVPSTGNALPPEAPYGQLGPVPRHVTFEPGTASHEELLTRLGRGILVTRLHYVRFVHRQRTIVTGMTRDGTYWVENGKVHHPVANLRMTESILGILRRTESTGRDLLCCADERGVFAPVVPEILTRGVAFSSATSF